MFTVFDWLVLHDVQASALRDVVTAYYMGQLQDRLPEVDEQPTRQNVTFSLGSQDYCFKTYVIPALSGGFLNSKDVATILQSGEFKSLATGQVYRVNTVHRGAELPPVNVVNWRGRPEDLMCLAHEAAHALQIKLSGYDTMPPIARETCAFIGELLLLRFAQKNNPALYLELEQVWAEENAVYLLDNLDGLACGLLKLDRPYHYYMNYPLARLAAVRLFARDSVSLIDLFLSGACAMKHLPIEELAAQTAMLTNYFPEFPDPDPNTSKLASYRGIGAVTVLDHASNNDQVRSELQDYYTKLEAHLFEATVLVWLSEDRRPMGCATWNGQSSIGAIDVTRSITPFGGHVCLEVLMEIKREPANSNELQGQGEPV